MTDDLSTMPPPDPSAAGPEPTRPSRRRLVLTIVVAAVAAIAAAIGTNAILHAINSSPSSESSDSSDSSDSSGSSDQPAEDQAEPFTSEEFGFTVDFPRPPKVDSLVQEVGEFSIPLTTFVATSPDDQFVIGAAEMPAGVLDGQDLDTFLTNSLAGSANGTGGEVTEQAFITVGGERAITGVIEAQDFIIHSTITFHNGIQFSITAITDDADAAASFLESFTFN